MAAHTLRLDPSLSDSRVEPESERDGDSAAETHADPHRTTRLMNAVPRHTVARPESASERQTAAAAIRPLGKSAFANSPPADSHLAFRISPFASKEVRLRISREIFASNVTRLGIATRSTLTPRRRHSRSYSPSPLSVYSRESPARICRTPTPRSPRTCVVCMRCVTAVYFFGNYRAAISCNAVRSEVRRQKGASVALLHRCI